MATPARLTLISPLRVWLVFNALFVALVASSWYSTYRLAVADSQKLVASQALTLTKSRYDDIKDRHFRDFVEGVGREFSDLYVGLRIGEEKYEFGKLPAPGHCSELRYPMPGEAAGAALITMCRPFQFSTAPILAVLLVYVVIALLSLIFVRRLESRTIATLAGFLRDSGVEIDADRDLIGIMADMRDIRARLDLAREQERHLIDAGARAELAEQVAHDIRSPLAALEVVAGEVSALPSDALAAMGAAIMRIRDIADDLLSANRARASCPVLDAHMLSGLIEPLVIEKRLQFRALNGVEIAMDVDEASRGSSALVQPAEFKRLLSNLVNNAVEAIDGAEGVVRVTLAAQHGRVRVVVWDNGRGMPPEVLSKIGRRGETHGKSGGSGLGLYHARTTVKSWAGSLELSSKVGEGTTVTIDLPLAPSRSDPAADSARWDAVLIDDDALTCATWKIAAARFGKKVITFTTMAGFRAELDAIGRESPIYIDEELGDEARGQSASLEIRDQGFKEIYLATGHDPEKFSGLDHLRGVVGKEPPWGREG